MVVVVIANRHCSLPFWIKIHQLSRIVTSCGGQCHVAAQGGSLGRAPPHDLGGGRLHDDMDDDVALGVGSEESLLVLQGVGPKSAFAVASSLASGEATEGERRCRC